MRKAFNFYRSYWEQMKLLNKEQKYKMFNAICEVQFLETNINDINFKDKTLNIVWTGVKHGIESSLNGYITKQKSLNKEVVLPLSKGGAEGVLQQEEEKGEEEVQYNKPPEINFGALLDFINKQTSRKFKLINKEVRAKYKARLKDGYKKDDIFTAIKNACNSDYHKDNNFKYLTPEFFSRANTLDKYVDEGKPKSKKMLPNPYADENGDIFGIQKPLYP